MTANSSSGDNDRTFCWEQVSRTNRVFRISHVFAPAFCADRLVPLYAFFSICEQMASSTSDEGIAESKLLWWRSECLHGDPGKSRHPVLREMERTGALALLPRESLQRLLDGVEFSLNASAPPDLESLKRICIDFQHPQAGLELAVAGLQAESFPVHQGQLARAGLLQLIRESALGQNRDAWWWVPMNLLARHGLNRDDIPRNSGSENVAGLFSEIFEASRLWGADGDGVRAEAGGDQSRLRHLFAINGLYSGQLSRLEKRTPDRYAGELKRLGIGDIYLAWKAARRQQLH